APRPPAAPPRASRALWALGAAPLALLLALLPAEQGPQGRRLAIEQALGRGDPGQALALMARAGRDGLPPGWVPPPRLVHSWGARDQVLAALEAAAAGGAPGWVRAEFVAKLDQALTGPFRFDLRLLGWLERVLAAL